MEHKIANGETTIFEYRAITRTNYFRVTDVAAFTDCIKNCRTHNNHPVISTQYVDHGVPYYSFCCEDHILGLIPNGGIDPDIELFLKTLQRILPADDAIIITEIGHERTDYLNGSVAVITKADLEIHTLYGIGVNTAKKLLNNPDWETQMDEYFFGDDDYERQNEEIDFTQYFF